MKITFYFERAFNSLSLVREFCTFIKRPCVITKCRMVVNGTTRAWAVTAHYTCDVDLTPMIVPYVDTVTGPAIISVDGGPFMYVNASCEYEPVTV